MILTTENLKEISKIEIKEYSQIYFDKNFLYYYNKSNILNKIDLKNDNTLKFSVSYLFLNYLKKFQDTQILLNIDEIKKEMKVSFFKYRTKSIIKLLEYDLIVKNDNLLYSFTINSETLLKNKIEFLQFNSKKEAYNQFKIMNNSLSYTATDGYKLVSLSNIDINNRIDYNDSNNNRDNETFYINQKNIELIYKKIDKKNKKDILFEIYENKIVVNNITVDRDCYISYPNLDNILKTKHNDTIKLTNIDDLINKLELFNKTNKEKIKALNLSINLDRIDINTNFLDIWSNENKLSDVVSCDSMIIENKVQYNLEFFLNFIKAMKNNNLDTIYYKNNKSIIYSNNENINLYLMPIRL